MPEGDEAAGAGTATGTVDEGDEPGVLCLDFLERPGVGPRSPAGGATPGTFTPGSWTQEEEGEEGEPDKGWEEDEEEHAGLEGLGRAAGRRRVAFGANGGGAYHPHI